MSAIVYSYRNIHQESGILTSAIILSIVLHLLVLFFANVDPIKPPEVEKVQVKLSPTDPEEKMPEKSELPGQILETQKKEKQEEALTSEFLSEFDSKAHSNKGKKSDHSESIKKVIPNNKPVPQVIAEKQDQTQKKPELERIEPVKKKQIVVQEKSKDDAKEQAALPFVDGTDLVRKDATNVGHEELSDSDVISIDSKNYKYFSYFNNIKSRILPHWETSTIEGQFGKLLVHFTIRRDGTLLKVEIIKSTGHVALDKAAVAALWGGNPYMPFPPTIKNRQLTLSMIFEYIP